MFISQARGPKRSHKQPNRTDSSMSAFDDTLVSVDAGAETAELAPEAATGPRPPEMKAVGVVTIGVLRGLLTDFAGSDAWRLEWWPPATALAWVARQHPGNDTAAALLTAWRDGRIELFGSWRGFGEYAAAPSYILLDWPDAVLAADGCLWAPATKRAGAELLIEGVRFRRDEMQAAWPEPDAVAPAAKPAAEPATEPPRPDTITAGEPATEPHRRGRPPTAVPAPATVERRERNERRKTSI